MSKGWNNTVEYTFIHCMLTETVTRVREMDPVVGDWCVSVQKMKVWVGTSSLAMGTSLEVNGGIVEDACWLCLAGDAKHINLAELNAMIKGINLTLQWQMTVLHLVTNSVCIH